MASQLLRQTVTENPFIPIAPTEPQAYFLTAPVQEIMYGGAGGGGKSVALLAAALQYVDEPRYAALLLRRRLSDLYLPDALIPLSHLWLSGSKARWNGQQHQWTFPSGATVTFGYLEHENDKYRYKGAAFNFVGYDELTQFSETQYRFLFSRLRRDEDSSVPQRMRSATNPGDVGHEWVRNRFIDTDADNRLFIPASLSDNPYLDIESYRQSLAELDPVTRAQVEHGDWDVRPEGNLFKRAWFKRIVDAPPPLKRIVRSWDLAATEVSAGNDPDWTVGCKAGIDDEGDTYLIDVRRSRSTPSDVQKLVLQTAAIDGTGVFIRFEQEPGSSGKALLHHYLKLLNGYAAKGVPSTGDKVTRANPFSSACERGAVVLVRGAWNLPFLDELCSFPQAGHDDQVDAATSAFAELTAGNRLRYVGAPVRVVG